eukprot:scaffold233971_cov46-Prasinocladus_malaysianus.AAC.5
MLVAASSLATLRLSSNSIPNLSKIVGTHTKLSVHVMAMHIAVSRLQLSAGDVYCFPGKCITISGNQQDEK